MGRVGGRRGIVVVLVHRRRVVGARQRRRLVGWRPGLAVVRTLILRDEHRKRPAVGWGRSSSLVLKDKDIVSSCRAIPMLM